MGKVVSESRGKGKVRFFDGRSLDDVDLSAAKAKTGSFVEVFGDMALNVLGPAEAKERRAAWEEVQRAARLAGA